MKISISLSLIFLHLSLLLPSSLPSQSLIETTCKTTPYYDLCLSSLLSNPSSSDADVRGLAAIMIDSTDALGFAHAMIKNTTDAATERPLDVCAELYIPVVKYTLPQARDALCKGQCGFAVYSLNDAAKQADACERMFSSRVENPMGVRDEMFRRLCVVAVAIINNILQKGP